MYVTAKNLWLKCNIKSKLGPKISGFLDIWRIIRLFSYPNATFCIYEQNLTFCYPMISVSDFLISALPLVVYRVAKLAVPIRFRFLKCQFQSGSGYSPGISGYECHLKIWQNSTPLKIFIPFLLVNFSKIFHFRGMKRIFWEI